MGSQGIHQNIMASDTKLMLSLSIYYIIPLLVMDKRIPVNSRPITSPPKMSLMLEVEHMPGVISKSRLVIVTHTDHFSQNKTFN